MQLPSRLQLGLMFVPLAVLASPELLAFSVGVPQPGSHNLLHWTQSSVNYYIHPAGAPGMTPAVSAQQLALGFQGWMDVPCGNLAFVQAHHCGPAGTCAFDKGLACTTDADCPAASNLKLTPLGTTNNRNELAFVATSAWTFGGYVLGVTSPSFDPQSGKIYEADIVFNAYYYNWVANFADAGPWNKSPTPTAKTKMHTLSVAIHEEGHFFGAQHVLKNYSQSDPPTMAPAVDPYGATASLTADDKKLICYLNPKPPYLCSSDADCPYINETDSSGQEFYAAKLNCDLGTKACSWTAGATSTSGKMGDVCSLDTDCTKPLFCQPVDATSYCSQICQTASPACGAGFSCIPYTNGNGEGACVPDSGGGTGPTQAAGDPCATSAECKTGTCFNKVCRVPCATKNPTQCTASEQCQATGKTGSGVCVPGNGQKGVGGACAAVGDCQSGACVDGFCRAKCVNKTDCPSGEGCALQPEGYSACVPGSGGKLPIGAQCTATADCISGVCVQFDASDPQSWCRTPCASAADCAGTEQCKAQADGSLACVPAAAVKKNLGEVCESSDSCESSLCVTGFKQAACTQFCKADDPATCPCGFECLNTTAGWLCFGGKKVACVPAGGACGSSGECAGGSCTAGKCVGGKAPDTGGGTVPGGGTCQVTAVPGTCSTDLNCLRSAPESASGKCHAVGPKAEFSPCGADTECRSLFCAADITANGANRCVRPCAPGENSCGAGHDCHPLVASLGACYPLAALGATGGGADDAVANGGGGQRSACSSGRTSGGAASIALIALAACLALRRRVGI